jgi:hypothetical protein
LGETFSVYEKAFEDYGIDNVSDLSVLVDEDWKALEVKPFHRKKMMIALNKL